ncbi:MAG: PucC family protein [Pseudomonadota bacterium]
MAETPRLTAILAIGELIRLALASRVLVRRGCPLGMAALGALSGVPAFAAVMLASVFAGSRAVGQFSWRSARR